MMESDFAIPDDADLSLFSELGALEDPEFDVSVFLNSSVLDSPFPNYDAQYSLMEPTEKPEVMPFLAGPTRVEISQDTAPYHQPIPPDRLSLQLDTLGDLFRSHEKSQPRFTRDTMETSLPNFTVSPWRQTPENQPVLNHFDPVAVPRGHEVTKKGKMFWSSHRNFLPTMPSNMEQVRKRKVRQQLPYEEDEVIHSNPGESDQEFLARALLFYGEEKGGLKGTTRLQQLREDIQTILFGLMTRVGYLGCKEQKAKPFWRALILSLCMLRTPLTPDVLSKYFETPQSLAKSCNNYGVTVKPILKQCDTWKKVDGHQSYTFHSKHLELGDFQRLNSMLAIHKRNKSEQRAKRSRQ